MTLARILCLIAVVAISRAQFPCTADGFQQYCSQFGKNYQDAAEYALRQSIYIGKCKDNDLQNAANTEFKLALNGMSDITEDEFKARLGNVHSQISTMRSSLTAEADIKIGATPAKFNWGDYCALTPVVDQGNCGCCWAFSSTGAAESFIKIRNGTELDLSEEYTLQCTTDSDCQGGYPTSAMKLITTKGVPTAAQYPYKAYAGSSTKPSTSGICTSSTKSMPSGTTYKTYSNLSPAAMQALIVNSPLVVYFWADTKFGSYASGVYSCSRAATISDLNHGVIVFGYDQAGNYLIKNSWGTGWGTNGFATINVNNDCGLTKTVIQYDNGDTSTTLKSGSCNVYQSAYGSSGKGDWRLFAMLQLLLLAIFFASF